MKIIYFLLTLCLIDFQSQAQTIFGDNNYTQYHIGNLPIIISVPHGGLVVPNSIPDRTCNNPALDHDFRTIELARQIDTALFKLTGCHPHLIICNLQKRKLDCNRSIADGACGNIQAEKAWTEFHNFIDTAQSRVANKFPNKALYIDLHGHGKPILRLELGYGLTNSMLNNDDNFLNSTSVIANNSSLENLVSKNTNGYTHSQLIRGQYSLGTMFVNAGFPAVPSQQMPNPGQTPFFPGGYNTFHYTSILQSNRTDGLQIECDTTVRFGYLNRKKFADSIASIFIKFMSIHHNINLKTNCGIEANNTGSLDNCFNIITNPVTSVVKLSTNTLSSNYEVIVINTTGEIVLRVKNQNQFSVEFLPKGMYFIKVVEDQKNTCTKKIIVQ